MKRSDERKAKRLTGLQSASRPPRSVKPYRAACGHKIFGKRCIECEVERQKRDAKL